MEQQQTKSITNFEEITKPYGIVQNPKPADPKEPNTYFAEMEDYSQHLEMMERKTTGSKIFLNDAMHRSGIPAVKYSKATLPEGLDPDKWYVYPLGVIQAPVQVHPSKCGGTFMFVMQAEWVNKWVHCYKDSDILIEDVPNNEG